MNNDFAISDNVKLQILAIPPEKLLSVAGNEKSFVCPFCNNGKGDDGTGLKPIQGTNGAWLYHCFRCDESFNNFHILAIRYNLDKSRDFVEICKRACSEFSISFDNNFSYRKEVTNTATKKTAKPKEPSAKHQRLTEAKNNLADFVKNQGGSWRGLSLETLQQVNSGFLKDFSHPKTPDFSFPAVIFPNDLNGIFARRIDDKSYSNIEPTATTTIFLPSTDVFDIVIVEGVINGASIFQAVKKFSTDLPNFAIIASGGTSGNKNVLAKLKELKDQGKNFRVIIAYDNDKEKNGKRAGQDAAKKLFDMLTAKKFPACIVDITKTPDIDLNDILRHDNGDFELFNLIEETLAQVDFPTDSISDTDSDDMHEVKETDINGETDTFEIEKNRVMKDSFNDDEINKFFIPLPYVITNHGIKKIGKKDITTICPRPILIKEKYYNLEDNTFKLSLEHLNANKQWKVIPPQGRGNIFNKNKIVELANFGLPVTTGNSAKIVDWIFNFDLANENYIPLTYTVNRCGWYNYKDNDYFIDPRIKNTVRENGKNIDIVVDSANQMATSLKTKGTLEKWKEAYNLATDSVVARATIAASVAAPLLKILNERNFVYYVFGKTRGGKSTALYLGASAVGYKDMVRVFDGTNNGLISALANTNHYSFFFDEKQAADSKFLAEKQRFIYLAAEGTERSRANKDGTARTVKEWRNIVICNGETELLDDTATGGAHTRLLQIHAQDTILDADTCKQIRNIIKDNYGHAFPLFINQLFKENFDELRQRYEDFQKVFSAFAEDNGGKILSEYAKYISLIFIADQILNEAIGNNIDGLDYGQLLKLIPTLEDIDDAKKEFNSVLGFIAEKAAHFVGSEFYNKDRGLDIYGKSQVSDDFTLLTVSALKKHCGDKSLDYEKVVSDCITHGYFIPDDKIRGNRKSVLNTVVKKISSINYNCFQIPNYFIFGDNN